MHIKTLILVILTSLLAINMTHSSEQKTDKESSRQNMLKRLKGEVASEGKPSACAKDDEACLQKESDESKKLMVQKLKGMKVQ